MLEAKDTTAGLEARARAKEEAGANQRPSGPRADRDPERAASRLSEAWRHRLFLWALLGPTVLIDDGAHPLPLYRAGDRRAYPIDRTPLALRASRDARVAPMQDQPVVRVAQVVRWNHRKQAVLDLPHVASRCQPGAVGDAEDVRIHRYRRFAERRIQHDVGGLATDAR